MTTIDEMGTRAAATARADAAKIAAARVESGLERLRLEGGLVVVTRRRRTDPRRWMAIGIAAALSAAAIIAIAVNANDSESHRLVPAGESTQPSSAPAVVATTILPDTTGLDQNPPDTVGSPIPSDAIAVRHDALPAAFDATAFVGMTDQSRLPVVAIGDTWIVLVDPDASTATLIDPITPSAPQQPVQLDVTPTGTVAAGPGDVLYVVVQGDGANMSLDAIALSGERVGQVVATAPISAVAFAEAPIGVLGHGFDGIIDRRSGETLLAYVDKSGAPTSLGRDPHTVGPILGDLSSGDVVVRDPDGSHDWHLTISRGPITEGSEVEQAPPVPSSHGGAVAWTSVGDGEPVVAVLAADGTGTWYSLADGWQVAASDLDGTILVRLNNGTVELARLDPPQRFDFLDQPAELHHRVAFAETLPTALLSAQVCGLDDLDIVPRADGAAGTVYGNLYLRNKGEQPCSLTGTPDVAFLDDDGNIVSSTDPSLLGHPVTTGLVLEHNSWGEAPLGPIASNVCGGNESSQFRFTLGGGSATVPFAAGGPVNPESCDPSAYQPPGPGSLAVQPFAGVEPNANSAFSEDGPTIAINSPSTVRAGATLKYDVVFTADVNPFVIDESNCPIYTESMSTASAQLLLNCNGTDGIFIQLGESVTFHIELPIPGDAALGASTLTWKPVEPTRTSKSAAVTIVA